METTTTWRDDNAQLWIKLIGVVLSIGWLLGVLWGIVAYQLGYRAGLRPAPYSGQWLPPPDSTGRRWVYTVLFALGMMLPGIHFVLGYFYADYLYAQGARVAASKQSN